MKFESHARAWATRQERRAPTLVLHRDMVKSIEVRNAMMASMHDDHASTVCLRGASHPFHLTATLWRAPRPATPTHQHRGLQSSRLSPGSSVAKMQKQQVKTMTAPNASAFAS